ncbi:MAG: nitroreductase family protein [Candidatus Firestonebacteria bacterium]
MNETLKTIVRRRSIRQFEAKQIKSSELRAILEAGLQAPSGHNDQSCFFSVIRDAKLIKELSDGSKVEMQKMPVPWIARIGKNEKLNIYYNAPTIILVAAKKDAVSPSADVAAAIQNILLAATSLNIGSCWIGFSKYYFSTPERNKKAGIPEGYEVHYAVALGYIPANLKLNPPERKYEKYYEIIES